MLLEGRLGAARTSAPRWKSSPNKLHELSSELETPQYRRTPSLSALA